MAGRVMLSVQPVAEAYGSDQALLSLVGHLGEAGWRCHLALPGRSPLAAQFEAVGAVMHELAMAKVSTSDGPSGVVRYVLGWPVTNARVVALARRVGADVIHSNSLHSWYGFAPAWLLGTPHIWHAREITFQSAAVRRLERALARRGATSVVAVSAAVAARLDPANVRVIFDEADPAVFGPGRAGQFRARCQIPDQAPVAGLVARIDTWKGVEVVLDAARVIHDRRPEVVVVVAGGPLPGPKAQYYQDMEAKAAATPGVRWLGYRPDVAELIADLDVLVMASTEPEPFGLVVVEALASGVPVVATDHGGPPEILAQAEPTAGRLVAPGDVDAMAEAVLALLPEAGSDATARQARPVLRKPTRPAFGTHFEEVAAGGRRRRGSSRVPAG